MSAPELQALRSLAVWGEFCPRMEAALAADAEAVEALSQALAQKDVDLQSAVLARDQEAAALQQAHAELGTLRTREDDLRREVAALAAKLQAREAESADRAKTLEVLTRELAGKSCEIQTKSEALASKDAELQQAISELGNSRKMAEDLESHLADARGKLRASEEKAAERAQQLEGQGQALAQKESELQSVTQEKAQKEAKLLEALAEADRLRKLAEHLDASTTAGPCARLPVGVLDTGRYRGASALDFYDAVLAIVSLEDIYRPGSGWPVQVTRRRRFDFGAPLEGVRVIPIGQFNSGKTWLIAQLSGAELPKGVSVHTEGISMKEAAADNLPIILLDTVGTNSPVDALPHGAQGHNASIGVEAVLQELRVQEDFYRQVCFEVGQVILFVVAQMSHKDQMDLVRMARAIRKDRIRKDIIVVHNLREWDVATLLQKSAKDGMNYVERNQTLFELTGGSMDVTIGAETRRVIRHQGLFKDESDGREIVVNVYHYYLTSHDLPCSCNNFAIQDMKATITRGRVGGGKSLATEFAAAATKVQNRFASFNAGEPQIVFDPRASCFRTKDPVIAGAYRMKNRDLGSYFTMGSDDPDYNIMLLRGIVKKETGRDGVTVLEDQERRAYQLQIELPGLCEKSLEDIREQIQRQDSTVLRRESLEGERGTQWTVSFQATLMNVPADVYDRVAKDTFQEVVLSKDVSVHDSGSRKHFGNQERTVKVTLRTGIMDYDTSEAPIVTYVDGVLGITLIKQKWG